MQKSTSLAFETILVKDGKMQNLSYHEERMNRTRRELFGYDDWLKIKIESTKNNTPHRCKVVYSKNIEKIEIQEYSKKTVQKLSLVRAKIDYMYKICDRSQLDKLFEMRGGDADDIIIVRDGLITDTTIANIAMYDGQRWLTPKKPLLQGTMRQKLLDEGILIEADILAKNLSQYKKIAIMNALRGFEELECCLV